MLPWLRSQSDTNLWDPKATRDSGDIFAVYGNLFAAAAIYATDADAWAIPAQGFLEGRSKRDRVEACDHLDYQKRSRLSLLKAPQIFIAQDWAKHTKPNIDHLFVRYHEIVLGTAGTSNIEYDNYEFHNGLGEIVLFVCRDCKLRWFSFPRGMRVVLMPKVLTLIHELCECFPFRRPFHPEKDFDRVERTF